MAWKRFGCCNRPPIGKINLIPILYLILMLWYIIKYFEKKKTLTILIFWSAMLLLLNVKNSYGEDIVFFFLSTKTLIGANREGMLDIWYFACGQERTPYRGGQSHAYCLCIGSHKLHSIINCYLRYYPFYLMISVMIVTILMLVTVSILTLT